MTKLYRARWVLPISSPAIEDGGVAVVGTRISGVGRSDELVERFPGASVCDFGEAALLPGFVNCHSHLELTAMRGFLEREEGDFFAWLKRLTLARNERMTAADLYVSAAWGAVEAARAGVTCVGDASDAGASPLRALGDVGLRGIVYQEAFGPDPRVAQGQFDKLRAKVESLRAGESKLVTLGISPHSPYTISAPLLELLTEYAVRERLPMMIHAAESRFEEMLLKEGRGPFVEEYRRRGFEWVTPGVSTIQYLNSLGVLRARPLLAHCIRVDERDIETIKDAGARVAHCPKSNAKLGHGRAPFAAFLRAKLDVGLGSDSVASNNACDLLEESRFATLLSRSAGDLLEDGRAVNCDDALRTATQGGARALGFELQTGALAEGLEADLVAVSLRGVHQVPAYDVSASLVFSSSGRDVLMTTVAGREVFRDGRMTTVDEEKLRLRMNEIARRLALP
ncbi:MAG: amidohydrolase family protein [Acidobacteria bacterium]|nr:amidohydrolase family protein [Acidobacteriota bacterium]